MSPPGNFLHDGSPGASGTFIAPIHSGSSGGGTGGGSAGADEAMDMLVVLSPGEYVLVPRGWLQGWRQYLTDARAPEPGNIEAACRYSHSHLLARCFTLVVTVY
jgi:hypothetical protein